MKVHNLKNETAYALLALERKICYITIVPVIIVRYVEPKSVKNLCVMKMTKM